MILQEGLGRKTVWKIENFRLVEVRDLSSYPMYKNKTLPSRNGSKKNGGEMRKMIAKLLFEDQRNQHKDFLYELEIINSFKNHSMLGIRQVLS